MVERKTDLRKRRNKEFTPDKLAEILREITSEKIASETFKKLTGMDIPDKKNE